MTKKEVILQVNELAEILHEYHHNECWMKTKDWFNAFGKNVAERAKFLKAVMYTQQPLISHDANENGEIKFSVLQGDIIKTKAAVTSAPIFPFDQMEYSYYIIVPSSCSIQPKKYKQVLLTRLCPINDINGEMKNAFLESINFGNNKIFYLPPIDNEQSGEYGFLSIFEEISHIDNQLLQSVLRIASLSLIGWRLLNAFLVNHYTRPSSDDKELRKNQHIKQWRFYE